MLWSGLGYKHIGSLTQWTNAGANNDKAQRACSGILDVLIIVTKMRIGDYCKMHSTNGLWPKSVGSCSS